MNDLLTQWIAQAGGGAPAPSCAQSLFPFALMIFIFYFLLIRPQRKRELERQETLSRLVKGQTVITSGGLIGTIHAVKEDEITLEIAEKVRVRVAKDDVDPYGSAAEASSTADASK